MIINLNFQITQKKTKILINNNKKTYKMYSLKA